MLLTIQLNNVTHVAQLTLVTLSVPHLNKFVIKVNFSYI